MLKNYELIYAGLLGKAIGVRLGAPIEPIKWEYETIQRCFGNIKGYIKDSERFAADDDTNGPIFFIRSLLDENEFSAQSVGNAWLNYARELEGMFWWGGDGISTEHTAYNNLKKGIKVPQSGSMSKNGAVMANQVGGQIFIDSWGYIFLGNPKKAADYAETAASVAHDENGLEGARFIAACIALAKDNNNVMDIVTSAMGYIDEKSEYYLVLNKVLDFYKDEPDDFRLARKFVADNYGYDKYPGACHIIPNAAIVLIGLLYSNNDFARGIEVTVMCAWDTDSNAGVVGSILGVMNGVEGIPHHYREPINDILISSSMSPYLNIGDINKIALELSIISDKVNRRHNKELLTLYKPEKIEFDFSIPGSSHGLKIYNDFRLIRDNITREYQGGFNVLVDNMVKNDLASIYLKTFYDIDYFGDDRYDPVFTPLAYSGQEVMMSVYYENIFLDDLNIQPYIRLNNESKINISQNMKLLNNQNNILEFSLPDTKGALISEIGFDVTTKSTGIDGNGVIARLIVNAFSIEGETNYSINFNKQKKGFNSNITPFANNRSKTLIKGDSLLVQTFKEHGIIYTGNYYTKELKLSATINSINGENFTLPFLIKGLENYYYFLIREESAILYHRRLLSDEKIRSFNFREKLIFDKAIRIKIIVENKKTKLMLNGNVVAEAPVLAIEYGHFGFGGINSDYEVTDIRIKSNV